MKSVLRSLNVTERALRKRLEKLEALVARFNEKVEAGPLEAAPRMKPVKGNSGAAAQRKLRGL